MKENSINIDDYGYYYGTYSSIDGKFLKIPGITETGSHIDFEIALESGLKTVLEYILRKQS